MIRLDDVIDFHDHLHDLGGELELLAFAQVTLVDFGLFHVRVVLKSKNYEREAVDADSGVLFLDLAGFGVGHAGNGVQAGVFGEGQRDLFQGVGESAHGVLFHSGNGLGLVL
jgi:hypothetical protein